MLVPGPYPYTGEIIWLTPEQGGRSTGIPPTVASSSYAHLGSLSADGPHGSLAVRGWDPTRWRSPAEARWLFPEQLDIPVRPGDVIRVVEGRLVAFFLVTSVEDGHG